MNKPLIRVLIALVLLTVTTAAQAQTATNTPIPTGATATPVVIENCYTYAPLGENSWGDPINIEKGVFLFGGLSTDNGELIINWSETYIVQPTKITIHGSRVSEIGSTSLQMVGEAFGLTFGSSTLLNVPGGFELSFEPNKPLVYGKNFSLTLQSSDQIYLSAITIYTEGVHPFPENNCAPVPDPVTDTPTPTGSATVTPVTPTATLPACIDYEYPANHSQWTGGIVQPQYGVTVRVVPHNGQIYLDLPYPVTLCSYTLTLSHNDKHQSTLTANWLNTYSGQSTDGIYTPGMSPLCCGNWENYTMGTQPSFPINKLTFSTSGTQGTGFWIVKSVTLRYRDIPPTATPTMTSTPTPTASRTMLFQTEPKTPTLQPTNISVDTRTPQATMVAPTVTAGLPSSTPQPTLTATEPPPPLPTMTFLPSNTPIPYTPIGLPTELYGTVTPWATYSPPQLTPLPGTHTGGGGDGVGTPGTVGTPGGMGTLVGTPNVDRTSIPIPDDLSDTHNDIEANLKTAVANINTIPVDLGGSAPDLGALPEVAGYMNWLFSGTSLQEIFGQKVYPIPLHMAYGLIVILFFSAVLLIFRVGFWFLRFAIWVIRFILKIIPFIG